MTDIPDPEGVGCEPYRLLGVCPGCEQSVLDSDGREHANDCDFVDGQGRALPTQVYLAHFRDGVEEFDATSLEHACRLAEAQTSDANPLVLVEAEDGEHTRTYTP